MFSPCTLYSGETLISSINLRILRYSFYRWRCSVNTAQCHFSLTAQDLFFSSFWLGLFSVSVAGAYSSGQRETAGVYELQSQVVRDAPQEVSALAPAVIKNFLVWLVCVFSCHCRFALLHLFVWVYGTDAICLITPPYCSGLPLASPGKLLTTFTVAVHAVL